MAKPLEKEFNYYIEHQKDIVEKHNGKFVVIKGHDILGAYNSELEAIDETSKHHKLGTFLIQYCLPGTEGYTQTYHSRVAFG